MFFTEKINQIALISNDAKRIHPINLTETYGYGMSKDIVSEKEKIKCSNMIKLYKKND